MLIVKGLLPWEATKLGASSLLIPPCNLDGKAAPYLDSKTGQCRGCIFANNLLLVLVLKTLAQTRE